MNQKLYQTLTTTHYEEFIQISPQHMKLSLRVGQAQEVKFKVAHALSYPVDLYYLMDLSNSMSDDRWEYHDNKTIHNNDLKGTTLSS